MDDHEREDYLSRGQLYALALATAVVVANAYYIHPIVAPVAAAFGVSNAMIGAVPAFNQIALALGIFLFLPLGDRVRNVRLATVFTIGQFIAIVAMGFVEDFRLFLIASTVLGLFTITPYLIPAYVSKRVDPRQLGHAVAIVTTGVALGILLARLGAGVIGEYFGWRTIYWIAALLLALVCAVLPWLMREPRTARAPEEQMSYAALLRSIFTLARGNRHVLLSGSIQGLNFGIFLSIWLAIGLHLPDIGYGVDVVGYLAGVSIINLAITPPLGKWTDRIGPRKARLIVACIQLVAAILLFLGEDSLWILVAPLLILTAVGPVIDICGRATILIEEPAIRTRLMTVYIMLMFIGGGMVSWAATATYELAGWTGSCLLVLMLAISVLGLSAVARRLPRPGTQAGQPSSAQSGN